MAARGKSSAILDGAGPIEKAPYLRTPRPSLGVKLRVWMRTTFGKGIVGSTLDPSSVGCVNGGPTRREEYWVRYDLYFRSHWKICALWWRGLQECSRVGCKGPRYCQDKLDPPVLCHTWRHSNYEAVTYETGKLVLMLWCDAREFRRFSLGGILCALSDGYLFTKYSRIS